MAQTSDCGKACCQSVAKWVTGKHYPIETFTHETTSDGMTNPQNIVDNLALAGLTAKVYVIPTGEEPPGAAICLVWYGGFNRETVQDKDYYGWHWVVYIGKRNGKRVIHDPNWWGTQRDKGAFLEVTEVEWDAAFITYPGNAGRVYVALT